MKLWAHVVVLSYIFWVYSIIFSTAAILIYNLTHSAQGFAFLHPGQYLFLLFSCTQLEYNCFTQRCLSFCCVTVNQLYVYMQHHPLTADLPFYITPCLTHLGYYWALRFVSPPFPILLCPLQVWTLSQDSHVGCRGPSPPPFSHSCPQHFEPCRFPWNLHDVRSEKGIL